MASSFVTVLHSNPFWFALALSVFTIAIVLLGGLNKRYFQVSYGTLLVITYTMLSVKEGVAAYWPFLLLSFGALLYGIISLSILMYRPWRPLEEQLSAGFIALSEYLRAKSQLFPSSKDTQAIIRNTLALQNVKVVTALEQSKNLLTTFEDAIGNKQKLLLPYYRKYILLQSLHERAVSSYDRYDVLSSDVNQIAMLEGIGQVFIQLASASKKMADSLLATTPYKHPVAFKTHYTKISLINVGRK